MTDLTPASKKTQAVFLRGHLRLVLAGMTNSKISKRQLLDKATAVTGMEYQRGEYALALRDLEEVINGAS